LDSIPSNGLLLFSLGHVLKDGESSRTYTGTRSRRDWEQALQTKVKLLRIDNQACRMDNPAYPLWVRLRQGKT
jgi:hypothetical protein